MTLGLSPRLESCNRQFGQWSDWTPNQEKGGAGEDNSDEILSTVRKERQKTCQKRMSEICQTRMSKVVSEETSTAMSDMC